MYKNIGEIDQNVFDRVWKLVQEIGEQERHFNDIQARYRSMASIWLLATFSAIGFVISKTISIDIDPEVLIAITAAAGGIGIILLWVVDLMVYHRLLDSCFIEGLILEEQYSWLPPMRQNMMNTQKGQGVLLRVVGFYLGPSVLLTLVAGGSLSFWVGRDHLTYAVVSMLLTCLLAGLVGYSIYSRTENTDAIERRLKESRRQNYL